MAIGDKLYNIEINDSEFEREGWKNARYKGTKLTSAKLNKFTQGDVTFGKRPVIEQYSRTVYVFNQAANSFESIAGIFYPVTDEFSQTLPDKRIVGSTKFSIDRAITFTVGQPNNFSVINPGTNNEDSSFDLFDTMVKTDLALFNSCSVLFFNNTNNGFLKPFYTVGYNRGDFKPAAAYFQSASTATEVSGIDNQFDYELSDNGRLYINPNVEDWFISQTGASGSLGTINLGNTAITLTHNGSSTAINSSEGYFFGLSSRLSPQEDSYYICFQPNIQGVGTFTNKNILKAFDVHELENSGSNIDISNNKFNIKTTGRYGGNFSVNYDGAGEEEFVLFRETTRNNIVHLDFNFPVEAPAGVGNGGIIFPDNLHPKIKENLTVYLGQAGIAPQGGIPTNFLLGNSVLAIEGTGVDPTIVPDPTPEQVLFEGIIQETEQFFPEITDTGYLPLQGFVFGQDFLFGNLVVPQIQGEDFIPDLIVDEDTNLPLVFNIPIPETALEQGIDINSIFISPALGIGGIDPATGYIILPEGLESLATIEGFITQDSTEGGGTGGGISDPEVNPGVDTPTQMPTPSGTGTL